MIHTEADRAVANEWLRKVIGAAIEVHKHLGPGLLESADEVCLCRELEVRGIPHQRQVYLDLDYKGLTVPNAYRIDLLVAGTVILEVKCLDAIAPIHEAQLLTYLRLSERWLGLLFNFNVPVMKDGIRRLVLG